jgi:glycopeptide antibiotics resistance protein
MITLTGELAYVVALPVAGWLATRQRSLAWRGLAILLTAYLAFAASLAFFPMPVAGNAWDTGLCAPHCNLRPLATIAAQLDDLRRPGIARQLYGNVLLLAPLGIALPVLVAWLRPARRFAVAGLILGASVEAAQLALILLVGVPFRTLDIDDALLNTLGLFGGYAAWWLVARSLLSPPPRPVRPAAGPRRPPPAGRGATPHDARSRRPGTGP